MSYQSQFQAAVNHLQNNLNEANETIKLLKQEIDDLCRQINRMACPRDGVIKDIHGQPRGGDCDGWFPPQYILDMANDISFWFDCRGIKDWSLNGIADRGLVNKLKSKINFMETEVKLRRCINRLREADLRAH